MPLPMSVAFVRYDQDGALQQGERQLLERDPCRLQLDCRTLLISLESPALHAALHTGSRYYSTGSSFSQGLNRHHSVTNQVMSLILD